MAAEGRSDLSFTLFLSEPDAYRRTANWCWEFPHGEETFRLPAGDLIVYRGTLCTRVEPVEPMAIGWF